MRVVYSTPLVASGERSLGVASRLESMITCWRNLGVDATVVPWPGAAERHTRSLVGNAARTAFGGRRHLRELAVREPDLVVVRAPIWTPWLRRLRRGWRVVFDCHGTDPGLRQPLEQAAIRTMRREADGCMFVTSLHAELYGIPGGAAFVGGNGSEFPRMPAPSNERPIVLYAAANALPHQGFDILVDLARRAPEFDFLLLVPRDTAAQVAPTSNLAIESPPDEKAVRAAFARADVALGTLALSRKFPAGEPAAAIKVRDSVAAGIPTLVPYRDELLEGLVDEMLVVDPSLDANVGALAARLASFASSAPGQRVQPATSETVSLRTLESRRLRFFRQLLSVPR